MPENTFSSESRRPPHRLKLKPSRPSHEVPPELLPLDLRRRRGATAAQLAEMRRQLADLIVSRAGYLPPADAALVAAVYRDGIPLSRLATAVGVDPTEAELSHLRRRLHRLARRCIDPLFLFVALNAPTLTPSMRRVATACVIQGLSVRRAALVLNLTHHAVRRDRESLKAIFDSSDQPTSRSPAAPAQPALVAAFARPPSAVTSSALKSASPRLIAGGAR